MLESLRYGKLRALWSLGKDGYLAERGWFRSFRERRPVDRAGLPVPWITYAAVDFLSGRLKKTHTMFEYGSGNGTLYWSRFVGRITSCEHNRAWAAEISAKLPSNADVRFVPLDDGDGYEKEILRSGDRYSVVLVDGERREECAREAENALADDGVLILDDSFREEYLPIFTRLKGKGFRVIEFSGNSPGYNHLCRTAVFYRDDNILDI